MNKDLSLGGLTMQLQALETETFEVRDYLEDADLLIITCSTMATATNTTGG